MLAWGRCLNGGGNVQRSTLNAERSKREVESGSMVRRLAESRGLLLADMVLRVAWLTRSIVKRTVPA